MTRRVTLIGWFCIYLLVMNAIVIPALYWGTRQIPWVNIALFVGALIGWLRRGVR